MRKMLTAAALMLAVMMVASTSHADTNEYTGNYTGAPVGTGLWLGLGDPDVGDFGGVGFAGTEGTPVGLTIADATGSALAFTVAQDLDGDTTAGEAGEPSISGCGTSADLAAAAVEFQEGFEIIVFLRSVARVRTTPAVEPCPGLATHGTITLVTETL